MPDRHRRRTPWSALLTMGGIAFTMIWASKVAADADTLLAQALASAYVFFGALLIGWRWRSLPRRSAPDGIGGRHSA